MQEKRFVYRFISVNNEECGTWNNFKYSYEGSRSYSRLHVGVNVCYQEALELKLLKYWEIVSKERSWKQTFVSVPLGTTNHCSRQMRLSSEAPYFWSTEPEFLGGKERACGVWTSTGGENGGGPDISALDRPPLCTTKLPFLLVPHPLIIQTPPPQTSTPWNFHFNGVRKHSLAGSYGLGQALPLFRLLGQSKEKRAEKILSQIHTVAG